MQRRTGRGALGASVPLLCSLPLNNSAPSRVLSYTDARNVVLAHAGQLAPTLQPDPVPLLDSLGRVLATPVRADRDQPPFPRSTRDGFACRAADFAGGPLLRVIGSIRAGEPGVTFAIGQGEAVEIMTGAPVPAGADCVVMVEHVRLEEGAIRLLEGRTLAAGENIVPQAAEAQAGGMILPAGTRIAAAQIAAGAACGAAQLFVFQRPRVAIVATGDELVELDQAPMVQQIRNSNSYSLAAQLLAAGAEPWRLPVARDERSHLQSIIRSALDADLLLLSGGVSMGKYDLVEEVLLELNAEFFFTGTLIQPGKPVVFGRLPLAQRPLYFFGLPGNPVSTMVTFLLFVRPLLAALSGDREPGPRFVLAHLASDLHVKPGLTRFLPAVLSPEITVQPVAWQGSGDLANTSRSNCFLQVPPDSSHLAAGETVTVMLA